MRILAALILVTQVAQAEMVTDLDGNQYDSDKFESYQQFRAASCFCVYPGYHKSLEYAALLERAYKRVEDSMRGWSPSQPLQSVPTLEPEYQYPTQVDVYSRVRVIKW